MSRKLEDARLAGSTASKRKKRTCSCCSGRLGRSAGLLARVGGHGWPGLRARRAGSGGTESQVCKHGGPGRGALLAGSAGLAGRIGGRSWPGAVWADSGGKTGSGLDRPSNAVGAGQVGQERAASGQGHSSCEYTSEWFLEMCLPSENVG